MATHWSRRRALRVLAATPAAGLAGCLSGPTSQVATTEPAPAVDLSFTASVEQPFTAEHPARVELALENRSDERVTMTVAHGIEGPFSAVEGSHLDTDATLLLFADPSSGDHRTPPGTPCRSDESALPDSRTDGCWRPACEYALLHAHASVTLGPDERLAWPYVVLDGFNDTCLSAGTYRFIEPLAIAVGVASPSGGGTPPAGWSHQLIKRLELALEGDGTLEATATLVAEADETVGESPPPTPKTVAGEG